MAITGAQKTFLSLVLCTILYHVLTSSLGRQLPVHHALEVEAQGLLQPLGVGVLDAGVGTVDVVAREHLLVPAQLRREQLAGEQLICCQH